MLITDQAIAMYQILLSNAEQPWVFLSNVLLTAISVYMGIIGFIWTVNTIIWFRRLNINQPPRDFRLTKSQLLFKSSQRVLRNRDSNTFLVGRSLPVV